MFKKVSELEWYLSVNAFTGKLIPENKESGAATPMTINDFLEFWKKLKSPEFINKRNIVVYAPFSENILLAPGEDLVIPLGFVIPDTIHWIQDRWPDLMFSTAKSYGNANAEGTMLRITNLKDKPYLLSMTNGTPLVSGRVRGGEKEDEEDFPSYMKLGIQIPSSSRTGPITLPIPGVFLEVSNGASIKTINKIVKNFYVSIADTVDGGIVFYIQKKMDEVESPLRDAIVDCISADDLAKLNLSVAFEEIYQESAHDVPIPYKRYMVAKNMKCKECNKHSKNK